MTLNLAAIALLGLVVGLFFFDWATLRGSARRMLAVEAAVFAGGAFFIVVPDAATHIAHAVGIGRGVDFILYPLVIWLVRESLVSRRRRFADEERLTTLVRAQALAGAREILWSKPTHTAPEPPHQPASAGLPNQGAKGSPERATAPL